MRAQRWLEFLTVFDYTLAYSKSITNGNTISCLVCQSLPPNTTALDLAASTPWKMAEDFSSGPAGFALVPLRSQVLPCVGWRPTPRALFGLGSLSPLPIFAIFAHTAHVRGLTTFSAP